MIKADQLLVVLFRFLNSLDKAPLPAWPGVRVLLLEISRLVEWARRVSTTSALWRIGKNSRHKYLNAHKTFFKGWG